MRLLTEGEGDTVQLVVPRGDADMELVTVLVAVERAKAGPPLVGLAEPADGVEVTRVVTVGEGSPDNVVAPEEEADEVANVAEANPVVVTVRVSDTVPEKLFDPVLVTEAQPDVETVLAGDRVGEGEAVVDTEVDGHRVAVTLLLNEVVCEGETVKVALGDTEKVANTRDRIVWMPLSTTRGVVQEVLEANATALGARNSAAAPAPNIVLPMVPASPAIVTSVVDGEERLSVRTTATLLETSRSARNRLPEGAHSVTPMSPKNWGGRPVGSPESTSTVSPTTPPTTVLVAPVATIMARSVHQSAT